MNTPETPDPIRAAFETWAKNNNHKYNCKYSDGYDRFAWAAYQAGVESRQAELVSAQAEVLEQCTLLGKSAEREAALLGKAEGLERELAAVKAEADALKDPAVLHAYCLRVLTSDQITHLFGERMQKEVANLRRQIELDAGNIERLQRVGYENEVELAALREDKALLDFLDSQVWPAGNRIDPQPPILQLVVKMNHDPHGEWVNCANTARAAIAAARNACMYCTNGIIRSLGRDNDEILEDCPHCSARKEVRP